MRLLNLVLRVCAVLVAVLDLGIVWLVLSDSIGLAQGVAGHLALCAVGAALLAASSSSACAWGWATLAMVVGFAVPGVGLLAIATAEAGSRVAGKGALFGKYQTRLAWGLSERRVLRPVDDPDSRIRLELSVQPLAEILSRGTVKQRRQALLAIAHEGSAEAGQTLAKALDDPDPDVRFVAGMALVHVEEKCVGTIAAALERVRQAPKEASSHQTLGDAYWSYAESGLLDPSGRKRCLESARGAYAAARDCDPDADRTLLALARVHGAQGDPANSLDTVDRHLARSPASVEGWLLKGQALFALRRLEALPEVGRQILALAPGAGLSDEVNDLARFWIGRQAA